MIHKKHIKWRTTNQPSKFRTRNCVEINHESRGRYDNSNFRFNLCDYIDAYIFAKGTITVPNMVAAGVAVNHTNEKVVFKNCVRLLIA